MQAFRLWLTGLVLGLTGFSIAFAAPDQHTTGFRFIGWKNDALIVAEDLVAADGTAFVRLEEVKLATGDIHRLQECSEKDSPAKKAAFESSLAEIRLSSPPGLTLRAKPCVAETNKTRGTVSEPIFIFPEQFLEVRAVSPGRYFLGLVSKRGNYQAVKELTPWLRRSHPDLFTARPAWGPNFYLEEVSLSPDVRWGAVTIEMRYALKPGEEISGFTFAVFQANALSARLYNLDGYRAYRIKEYYTAVPYFQWAATRDPSFDLPVYNLACTYGLLGLDEEAVSCLLQAVHLNKANKEKARKDPDLAKLREKGKLDFILQ